MDELISVGEAAALVGMGPAGIQYHERKGNLQAVRLGVLRERYFKRGEVQAFANKRAAAVSK